jgi:CP family cyanate transporter-like MFS transporter
MHPTSRPSRARGEQDHATPGTVLLLAGVALLAATLRPSIALVGPILAQIRSDLGLSSTEVSLLSALPVLFFGLFAPAAPALQRRLGIPRSVLAALIALLAGSLLRLAPGWEGLVAGTCLLSAGIAVGNVLLPVLAKAYFPARIGLLTGVSTMSLNLAAASAAATIVPLTAMAGGQWREGMLVWTAPAAAAILCWAALALRRPGALDRDAPAGAVAAARPRTGSSVLRSRTARSIIAFTASQSVIYYCILSWLPSIYQSHGASAASSGVLLSITTLIGAPVALVVPSLAARTRDQRWLLAPVVGCTAAGLAGLLLDAASAPALWAILLGVGLGGAFPLALALFAIKTPSSDQTASLSMLAQTAAYLLAAAGPFTLGLLHDRTGSWSAGIALLIACLAVELAAGLGAARPLPQPPAQDTPGTIRGLPLSATASKKPES